jgi:hypothetical protein
VQFNWQTKTFGMIKYSRDLISVDAIPSQKPSTASTKPSLKALSRAGKQISSIYLSALPLNSLGTA